MEDRDLETIFAQVEDPRLDRTKLHRLRDILILAMCGVICGAERSVEIKEFGKAKQAWFPELLDQPNGIPSHDTFGRVFALIDPNQFEASFLEWVQEISVTVQRVIAIYGKTLRRSSCMVADDAVTLKAAMVRARSSSRVTWLAIAFRTSLSATIQFSVSFRFFVENGG